jgi:hypothetical protein
MKGLLCVSFAMVCDFVAERFGGMKCRLRRAVAETFQTGD